MGLEQRWRGLTTAKFHEIAFRVFLEKNITKEKKKRGKKKRNKKTYIISYIISYIIPYIIFPIIFPQENRREINRKIRKPRLGGAKRRPKGVCIFSIEFP